MRSVAGGGVRVVEMPGRQGDGGQRGSGGQRIELRRKEERREKSITGMVVQDLENQ